MNSPSLISSAKESGAYIRVNKEVEQNDYGNDHAPGGIAEAHGQMAWEIRPPAIDRMQSKHFSGRV
jgi:hypothetical protein